MKRQSRLVEVAKANYLVFILALLGFFAFLTAVLIAWPSLAIIGEKLFG